MAKGTKNLEVVNVAIDTIEVKEQIRKTFDANAMKELVLSIKENGVKIPILLSEEKGKLSLVAGERRLKACVELGMKTIPAIIQPMNSAEIITTQFIENVDRHNLTPIEIAKSLKEMINQKVVKNQKELATRLGKTQAWVTIRMNILKCPQFLQDAIERNEIKDYSALEIMRLPEEYREKMFADAIAGQWSAIQIQNRVNDLLDKLGERKTSKNPKIAEKAEAKKVNKKESQIKSTLDTDELDELDELDGEDDIFDDAKTFELDGQPEELVFMVNSETTKIEISIDNGDDKSFQEALKFLTKNFKTILKTAKESLNTSETSDEDEDADELDLEGLE